MKNIVKKAISGSIVGMLMGFVIPLFISIARGDGMYIPCTPMLVKLYGNEINAVIIQEILSALLGVSYSVSTILYEKENFSLLKSSFLYFSINFVSMVIVAYFCYWINFTILGVISYFIQYSIIFLIVWIMIYIVEKNKINKINNKIKKMPL